MAQGLFDVGMNAGAALAAGSVEQLCVDGNARRLMSHGRIINDQ
jgi:hypothetical protein